MRGRVVTFMHILFCTFLKHTVNLAQTGIRALKKKNLSTLHREWKDMALSAAYLGCAPSN